MAGRDKRKIGTSGHCVKSVLFQEIAVKLKDHLFRKLDPTSPVWGQWTLTQHNLILTLSTLLFDLSLSCIKESRPFFLYDLKVDTLISCVLLQFSRLLFMTCRLS